MPPLGWRKHKDGKQAKGAAPNAPKTPKEPEPNKSSATSTLQAALFDLMTRHGKASCTFTEIYQHITRWFRPNSLGLVIHHRISNLHSIQYYSIPFPRVG